MRFTIVIYPSEFDSAARFTAHCLNMDLVADSDSVEGAVSDLLETIEAQLEAAQKYNAEAFHYAPQRYWDKLKGAKELSRELRERIIFDANRRLSRDKGIDVESQFDLRQLECA